MDVKVSARPMVDGLNPLPIGTQLQEFVIERLIGMGGFGIVYQARDTQLNRSVAIKEYMPTMMASRGHGSSVTLRSESYSDGFQTGKDSFINEARMLARFKHPALIEVFRFWEQNYTAYMAMPYYEGQTLKETLRQAAVVPTEATMRRIFIPVLDALQHMHSAQVYHRDISPDNIMILEDGRPILLDLGAARAVEIENAQAVTVLVKPGYAPIEQYSGDEASQQGPWTDIYGIGASVFFALTGKPPPPAASRVMRDSIIKLADANIAGYSPHFLSAIDAALAVRSDDRPQSISALKAMLKVEADQANDSNEFQRTGFKSNELKGSAPQKTELASDKTASLSAPNRVNVKAKQLIAQANTELAKPARAKAEQTTAEQTTTEQTRAKRSTADPANAEQEKLVLAEKSNAPTAKIVGGLALVVTGLMLTWLSMPNNKGNEIVTAKNAEVATTQATQVTVPVIVAAPVVTESSAQREPTVVAEVKSDSQIDSALALAKLEAEKTEATKIEAAKIEAAKIEPPPAVARLLIKPWGEVFINGESRGVTPPLKVLSLTPGDYKVEVRNGDFPAYRVNLKVQAGQTVKLNHVFGDTGTRAKTAK